MLERKPFSRYKPEVSCNKMNRKGGRVPARFSFMNPNLLVPGVAEEPLCVKGSTLDRMRFEEMRKEFYELRGWDPETGLQRIKTLERLGLPDLAKELKRMELIR